MLAVIKMVYINIEILLIRQQIKSQGRVVFVEPEQMIG